MIFFFNFILFDVYEKIKIVNFTLLNVLFAKDNTADYIVVHVLILEK